MFRSIERALARAYEVPHVNELQMAMTLFFVRIYRVTRAHYEWVFYSAPGRRRLAFDGQQGPAAGGGAARSWQWAGFPRLPAIFEHYGSLSSAYMAYVAVRNLILLDHLHWLIKLEKPAHCYLIGYFHFHPELARDCATIFALYHLAWRSFQALVRRPFFLPMFLFLLFADRDLELFERRLAWNEAAFGRPGARQAGQPLGRSRPPPKRLAAGADADPVYHLFRRVLCYKVEYPGHTSYRLRPNRTAEARRALRKRLAQCVLYVGGSFVLLVIVASLSIATYELNDRSYLERYAHCDPQLELAKARNELAFWGYSARAHQLLTVVADAIENIVLWVDSGVALMFVWTTIYLLNYDTQLHLVELDAKLQRVHLLVRAHHLAATESSGGGGGEGKEGDGEKEEEEEEDDDDKSGLEVVERRSPGEYNELKDAPELEEAVRDLQAHFLDFFGQIGETDLIISDIITASMIIWLTSFSVIGRRALRLYVLDSGQLNLFLVTVFCFSLLIVSVGTFAILELHRNCLRSHSTLCSLVAHDRSRFKLRLIKLLEFLTVRQRSAYTIFQQYPYTKTTYLTIFGWSLSCLFIFDNLIRR